MAVPHEVMFQNQLQFNMNVPLTTYNMTTHFHRPCPITIERTFAQPPNQGFPMVQLANRDNSGPGAGQRDDPAASGFQFSALSQDRMAAAVQMAQRDLKNQKLQMKSQQEQSRQRSLSPAARRPQKLIHGTKQWESHRSRVQKKSASQAASKGRRMGVREHDKNRKPRSAGSQTPPSSPPRQAFLNTKLSPEKARSDSPPTRDTPSLTRVAHVPADDIEKLQLEMELCLQQIESVQKRALSEHSTDFLRRGQASGAAQNALRLMEEEGKDRRQVRASEQAHRALRTIYNLQQQVKAMERQAVKLPRESRATKKSQASQRLMMINKGAVKLLQTFVAQLPQLDLQAGLPSHFADLSELVRQVTLLSAGAPLDKKARESSQKSMQLSPIEADVMAMVDQVEKLNSDWQKEVMSRESGTAPANQKPPFVTSFKSTKPAFTKEQVNPHLMHNSQLHKERKAFLQEGIKALLSAGRHHKKTGRLKQNVRPYHAKLAQPPPPKGFSYKVPTRKPPPTRKGYLLPSKVQAQRAPGPQPIQLATHFADPTITANLKASTMLHNPFMATQRSRSEPPSLRDRKKVNFIPPYAGGHSHHASYPGTSASRSRTFQRSVSAESRLSRSHSPRVHFSGSGQRGRHQLNPYDSEHSLSQNFTSEDEASLSPAYSVESFPGISMSHRSLSPVDRSHGKGQLPRQRSPRSRSPSAQRRQFFVADASPEFMRDLFPEDNRTAKSRRGRHQTKSGKGAADLAPYVNEVERRVQERLASLTRSGHLADNSASDQEDLDRVADAILEEAIREATQEATCMEHNAAAAEVAASYIDNPTLENILQALENMEKENEQLRRKYCTVTFHDSVPRRRRYQKSSEVFSEFRSDQPREPPAFEVTNTKPPPQEMLGMPRAFPEELTQEPIIFTKDSKAYRPHVTFQEHAEGDAPDAGPTRQAPPPPQPVPRSTPSALRPKTLLSMKQTVVERITESVERFDYYQRGLKQHLGKRKPFDLYESVADNVLRLCCQEVAQELEHINADMAENIYTSEFMSETGLPLAPPELAEDFETDGMAAQNLRESAAAQRTVEAAVSKTVTSLMLPPEEPELSVVSPKRVIETEGDVSPWDTSLKHVYDATALYEASITADKPVVDGSQGKAAVKDDDTHVQEDDYDYDDDYTDISDEDDEEDEDDETESPSP